MKSLLNILKEANDTSLTEEDSLAQALHRLKEEVNILIKRGNVVYIKSSLSSSGKPKFSDEILNKLKNEVSVGRMTLAVDNITNFIHKLNT